MNIKGLFLAVPVAIGLLFISKWFILLDLILVPYIMQMFQDFFFKCPACGNVQKDNYYVLSKETNTYMSHGRRTKSGRADKRYNTTYDSNTTVNFGLACKKCANTFQTTRQF